MTIVVCRESRRFCNSSTYTKTWNTYQIYWTISLT